MATVTQDRLRGRVPLTDRELADLAANDLVFNWGDLSLLCREPGCSFEVMVSEVDPDASQSEFIGHARQQHPDRRWQDVLTNVLVVRGAVA